jgi:hypothetical protein
MLKHELRRTEGILVLRPEAPLEATDSSTGPGELVEL